MSIETEPQTSPRIPDAQPLPRTQSIAEARELLSFATQTLEALCRADERLGSSTAAEEERAWLGAAARRVRERVADVEAALGQAGALPEFLSQRQARAQLSFVAWVDAAEALLVGISSQASPNNPLIEVLFPHQKLDKVRRGGAMARAFMAEVERRRRMSYVVRLSSEREYTFLAELLGRFDEAKAEPEHH